jgi:STAS-like domain of unknown function (DUF4325)
MMHQPEIVDTGMRYSIRSINGDYCITPQCGQALYDIINPLLLSKTTIELDFTGVKAYACPFFNYAMGQLLKDTSRSELHRLVIFVNLSPLGTRILEMVLDTAQRYYSDNDYRQAVDAVLEEELTAC